MLFGMRFNGLNSFMVPFFDADKGTPSGGGGTGGGFVDESTDDDPNVSNDDLDLGVAEDMQEDEPENAEEESSENELEDDENEEEASKEIEPPGPKMVSMTQDELDRIISDRLERDRRTREAQEQQKQQQAQQQQQFNQWYNSELATQTKFYAEKLGLDDDTATVLARRDVDNQVRIMQAEQVSKQSQESWQAQQKIAKYQQDKIESLSKNPLVAKYIKEIDAFAQNGAAGVDFMVATKYVLGEKIASGELLDTVTSAVEQKTLKNVGKRQKLAVEKDSQPGASTAPKLTPEQKRICRNLGISEKLYLSNLPKKGKR